MALGGLDGPTTKLTKCRVFEADKTYVGEMSVKWKALVGCKAPGQTSYRSQDVEVADHEHKCYHDCHCCGCCLGSRTRMLC
jgi:hypothetical protein